MNKVYSIKDNAIGFDRVFTCPNDAMALRMFADTCRQEGNQLSDHPEDFSLWCLGELDSENGLSGENGVKECAPRFLDKAVTYVRKKAE